MSRCKSYYNEVKMKTSNIDFVLKDLEAELMKKKIYKLFLLNC